MARGEVIVHPLAKYAAAHLPFAHSLSLAEIEQCLSGLPHDKDIVAYCHGPFCLQSDEPLALLQARGHRVRKILDAVSEWQAAGMPVVAA